MNYIVNLLRTSTFEDYKLGLPQNDLELYFLEKNWLSEFKQKDYVCTELKGDIEIDYEDSIDIVHFNNLLLEFKKLAPDVKEKVKVIFQSMDNVNIDALQYSIENEDKYVLLPNSIPKEERVKYILEKVYKINNYDVFKDLISANDFIMQLFRKGYAYEIGDDILIKKNDMLER